MSDLIFYFSFIASFNKLAHIHMPLTSTNTTRKGVLVYICIIIYKATCASHTILGKNLNIYICTFLLNILYRIKATKISSHHRGHITRNYTNNSGYSSKNFTQSSLFSQGHLINSSPFEYLVHQVPVLSFKMLLTVPVHLQVGVFGKLQGIT